MKDQNFVTKLGQGQMQILILLCYLVVAGGIAWITSHIQLKETSAKQVFS